MVKMTHEFAKSLGLQDGVVKELIKMKLSMHDLWRMAIENNDIELLLFMIENSLSFQKRLRFCVETIMKTPIPRYEFIYRLLPAEGIKLIRLLQKNRNPEEIEKSWIALREAMEKRPDKNECKDEAFKALVCTRYGDVTKTIEHCINAVSHASSNGNEKEIIKEARSRQYDLILSAKNPYVKILKKPSKKKGNIKKT